MKEVKLFYLLKYITRQEFDEIEDFIKSPIFNRNKSYVKLYNYLKENYHDALEGNISKEDIYQNVFDSEKLNETKYWKLISGLSGLIDKYLIFCEFQKDKYYQKNLLLESYRKHNIYKQFEALSKEIEKSYKDEFSKGINFYLNQTHYYFQKFSYLGTASKAGYEEDVNKFFTNLKMFYIMTNLTSINIISNFKEGYIKSDKNNLWMFRQIINYLTEHKDYLKKEHLTVYIFFLMIQLKINFNTEKYYHEIKSIILKNKYKFSKNLFRHILLNILDYAVKKLAAGEKKYLVEIFFINTTMDENALTLFGEYIQEDYFYSVVEHSTMLEEMDWAKKFIEKYKNYLNSDFKESAINLAMSRINFESGNLNSSLTYLLHVENLNPYFYLSHKVLLLQNYFERKDFNSINHVLETLNKYLKRRIDIANELKEHYIKFFYYFKKLKKISVPDLNVINSLLLEIRKEKFFFHRKWLIEKINEWKI